MGTPPAGETMTKPLTSRDRIASTLNFEETDRVPLDIGGINNTTMHVTVERKLKEYLGIEDRGKRDQGDEPGGRGPRRGHPEPFRVRHAVALRVGVRSLDLRRKDRGLHGPVEDRLPGESRRELLQLLQPSPWRSGEDRGSGRICISRPLLRSRFRRPR